MTSDKQQFLSWAAATPPKNTYVWGKWAGDARETLVKTCSRGCCVYLHGNTLMLPKYWRPATDADIEKAIGNKQT